MTIAAQNEQNKTELTISTPPKSHHLNDYRYDVRAWATEDSPMPLRLQVGTSDHKGLGQGYNDIESAHKRCDAFREAGYFCWVHDTQENLNVSPYLAAPIPMSRQTR